VPRHTACGMRHARHARHAAYAASSTRTQVGWVQSLRSRISCWQRSHSCKVARAMEVTRDAGGAGTCAATWMCRCPSPSDCCACPSHQPAPTPHHFIIGAAHAALASSIPALQGAGWALEGAGCRRRKQLLRTARRTAINKAAAPAAAAVAPFPRLNQSLATSVSPGSHASRQSGAEGGPQRCAPQCAEGGRGRSSSTA